MIHHSIRWAEITLFKCSLYHFCIQITDVLFVTNSLVDDYRIHARARNASSYLKKFRCMRSALTEYNESWMDQAVNCQVTDDVSFSASAFSYCTIHKFTIDLKKSSIQIARTYLPNYHSFMSLFVYMKMYFY